MRPPSKQGKAGKTSWSAVGLCSPVCGAQLGRPPWPTEEGQDGGRRQLTMIRPHHPEEEEEEELTTAQPGLSWIQLHPPALGSSLLLVLVRTVPSRHWDQNWKLHTCDGSMSQLSIFPTLTKSHSSGPQLDAPPRPLALGCYPCCTSSLIRTIPLTRFLQKNQLDAQSHQLTCKAISYALLLKIFWTLMNRKEKGLSSVCPYHDTSSSTLIKLIGSKLNLTYDIAYMSYQLSWAIN